MKERLKKLKLLLRELLDMALILNHEKTPNMHTQTMHSIQLYQAGKDNLGKVLSGNDRVLGCAATVNALAKLAWGHDIGGDASTTKMYEALQDETKYEPVVDPLPGDIIISPTGTSLLGSDIHGHVGIVAYYGILSNSSETGELHENFTVDTWNKYFRDTLQFPVFYYRPL